MLRPTTKTSRRCSVTRANPRSTLSIVLRGLGKTLGRSPWAQTQVATLFIRMNRPSVTTTTFNGGADNTGRITIRSTTAPMAAARSRPRAMTATM